MSVQSEKSRQLWLDVARGAGVTLVAYGHVMRGLNSAHALPHAPWVNWSDFTLYSFHMPLFFFLSGVNVFHSLAKGRGAFLSNRLWTVAWPYILWSLIQGGIGVALASRMNSPQSIDSLLRIGWAPIGQFWFLYALMALHLVVVLVGRRPILLLALGVLGFAASALVAGPELLGATLHGSLFYAIGMAVGPWLLAHTPERRPAAAWLALSAPIFVASVALTGLWVGLVPRSPWVLPSALAGGIMVLSASWLARGPIAAGLAYVGRASMTVYVLHILAASGVRIILKALGFEIDWRLIIALSLVIGVAAPTLAYAVLKRLNLLWPLGLASPPRRPPTAAPVTARLEQ